MLPQQSPLFWVQQKDRYLRQLLVGDIEAMTGRRLVVYFANRYVDSAINTSDVANLAEILSDVKQSSIDILIETGGGSTDATESLISLIQSSVRDFRVIVANAAKSNGTLLALAATSIIMGATSELGPIEPSLAGIPCSILDTPQIAASNFPLHRLGQFALAQSRSLANSLLTKGMMNGKTPMEVAAVVEALATRSKFPSHGSVVDHREALALGLSVTYLSPDDEFWHKNMAPVLYVRL
jgi:membrane-bound ClpP family serine protease